MPGRSAPMMVTTSEVNMAVRSSVSETLLRMIGALVAKRSSCATGRQLAMLRGMPHHIGRAGARPIGASARSHSSRAVSPPATKHQSCAAIAPASQPLRQVMDRSAGDRIALQDRPFHRGDAAMARQERRMIADATEARTGKRLVAHARVRVCRDDEVGPFGDRVAGNDLRIFEHVDGDAVGLRRERQTVVFTPARRRARCRRDRRARRAVSRTPWRRNSAIPPACISSSLLLLPCLRCRRRRSVTAAGALVSGERLRIRRVESRQ